MGASCSSNRAISSRRLGSGLFALNPSSTFWPQPTLFSSLGSVDCLVQPVGSSQLTTGLRLTRLSRHDRGFSPHPSTIPFDQSSQPFTFHSSSRLSCESWQVQSQTSEREVTCIRQSRRSGPSESSAGKPRLLPLPDASPFDPQLPADSWRALLKEKYLFRNFLFIPWVKSDFGNT